MSRIISLLAVLLLALACLTAAAEPPAIPVTSLGGTSWVSTDGITYHFTGNPRLFFSFDPDQPMYHFIGDSLYLTTPAAEVGGPYIVLDSARVCEFTFDGDTLLISDRYDADAQRVFCRVDFTASVANTRWQGEHGDIFEFSADGMEFSCWQNTHYFARTQSSLGAYYEMTIGMDGERWYEPDRPFALLLDGDTLRVYGTRDDVPYLWQTFTRIAD